LCNKSLANHQNLCPDPANLDRDALGATARSVIYGGWRLSRCTAKHLDRATGDHQFK